MAWQGFLQACVSPSGGRNVRRRRRGRILWLVDTMAKATVPPERENEGAL
jgi:hypothetical protein